MNPDTAPRSPRQSTPLLLLFLSLLLGGLTVSCSDDTDRTAVLLTAHSEFTSYAEQFNTSQDTYRLIVQYDETPRTHLRSRERSNRPDLIIDTHLNSRYYLSRFATLEKLFMDNKLSKQRFYQEPLRQGTYENQQVILPVSFSLPALLQKEELELGDAPTFFYSLEDVKNLSRNFNRKGENGFTALGFAPSWSPEMLYVMSLLRGANFRESSNSTLLWNGENLKKAVEEIRAWPQEVNESKELQQQFTQKYLYDPKLKLLRRERILFHYTDTSSFYTSPEKRTDFESHWLSADKTVPVLPDILFAGIPHGAEGIEAARAFLAWFFRSDHQEELIRNSMYKQLQHFGIAGGFSSLPQVNEEVLPRYYSSLVGHSPRESYLDFPPPLPPDWKTIKEEVIKPWLMQQAKSGGKNTPPLREKLDAWMRQRPSGAR